MGGMILFNAQNNMPQQLTYYIIITTQYPPYSSFIIFILYASNWKI